MPILGRSGDLTRGDVVVTYELVVQTGFGIIDGFLHFVFLLCLSMIIVHKGWSIVECTDNEKTPLADFFQQGAQYIRYRVLLRCFASVGLGGGWRGSRGTLLHPQPSG